MFKKLLIMGGIALVGYVINEVRKQYDENVNDYNDLVDKYNEMSDFIQNCNFYTYKNPKSTDENTRFYTESQTMPDGSKLNVKHDKASGFSIISYEDA